LQDINLPTCGIAFLCLLLTLKLNPTNRRTFAQFSATFDFSGLCVPPRRTPLGNGEIYADTSCSFLLMAGGALLIVGFAKAADEGFDSPDAYGVIIGGGVAMILAIVNCLFTKRTAIIPAVSQSRRQQKSCSLAARAD
jgi:hypothetical protein